MAKTRALKHVSKSVLLCDEAWATTRTTVTTIRITADQIYQIFPGKRCRRTEDTYASMRFENTYLFNSLK